MNTILNKKRIIISEFCRRCADEYRIWLHPTVKVKTDRYVIMVYECEGRVYRAAFTEDVNLVEGLELNKILVASDSWIEMCLDIAKFLFIKVENFYFSRSDLIAELREIYENDNHEIFHGIIV